jgi:hypothetical protein
MEGRQMMKQALWYRPKEDILVENWEDGIHRCRTQAIGLIIEMEEEKKKIIIKI